MRADISFDRDALRRPRAAPTITEGNAPAIRLYQNTGFQVWGVQPMAIGKPSGYKGRVHMWRTLGGHARGTAA